MKILRWVLPIFFALMMPAAGGISAVFLGLAVVLTLPISKIKELKQKMKIGPKLTALLTVAVFLTALIFSGPAETPPVVQNDPVSASSSSESVPVSSSEEPDTPEVKELSETSSEAKTPDEQSSVSKPADSTFSIHFIDVGQADASLVECDGHYMLIDGGNKGDSNLIYSVLKKAEVRACIIGRVERIGESDREMG